jgi:hypothetical protein
VSQASIPDKNLIVPMHRISWARVNIAASIQMYGNSECPV